MPPTPAAEECTSLLYSSPYGQHPLPQLQDPDHDPDDTLALALWSSFCSVWAAKHNLFGTEWTVGINAALMLAALALVSAASVTTDYADSLMAEAGLSREDQELSSWVFAVCSTVFCVSVGTALMLGYTKRLRVLPPQMDASVALEEHKTARLARGALAWSRSLALFGDGLALFLAAPWNWTILSSLGSTPAQLMWLLVLALSSVIYLELHDPDKTHTSWRTQELWRSGHGFIIGVIAWLLALGWTDIMHFTLKNLAGSNSSWLLLCCFGYAGLHFLAAVLCMQARRSHRQHLLQPSMDNRQSTRAAAPNTCKIAAIEGGNFSMGVQLFRKVLIFSAARALMDSLTTIMDHHDGSGVIDSPLLTRFGIGTLATLVAAAATLVGNRRVSRAQLQLLDVRALQNSDLFQRNLGQLERCNDTVDSISLGIAFFLALSYHQVVTGMVAEWGHEDTSPDLWGYAFGALLASGLGALLLFNRLSGFSRALPADLHRPILEPLKEGSSGL